MPEARRLLIDLTIVAAIGLVLAVLGPFGSFGAPFAWRLAYWLAVVLAGYGCYRPATALASRAARVLDLPEAALWALACVLATVPMTVLLWAASGLRGALRVNSASDWLNAYANVLVLGSAITAVFWFARKRGGSVPDAVADAPAPVVAAEPAPPAPAFLDRLPPHLGRDLIALEMEDHYVRAHTPLGSTLILMRMRDAVAELAGVDGRLVHRSWWVARAHVRGATRDGRNLRLALTGGIEAPVARGQAEALQAADWPIATPAVPPRATIG
ncbi:LytTR family DNA-binding domain-containing protein [Sphingomonas sp. VNH70]|uniref:LytTR family DNA-binding domain-containing protein n=1 Tax=Sphingomonas silueang TaxID=3156617 RepID=UPI0032B3728E